MTQQPEPPTTDRAPCQQGEDASTTPTELQTVGSPAVRTSVTIRGAVLNSTGAQAPYAQSRPITVDELTLSGPARGEVLVRIEAAGLCHSDLSVVNGSRPRPLPMLLGHEAAGTIEATGADTPEKIAAIEARLGIINEETEALARRSRT